MLILRGRIAQLVERLSYTQVVIGSSPVAPMSLKYHSNAGVVQLVRAPPCHGGSCGFEPRLPRILSLLALIVHILLAACSSPSLDDFRGEGQTVNRALIAELQQVRSRDDLPLHAPRLDQLFYDLVDIMMRADDYKRHHPDAEASAISPKEQAVSDELRTELNRVLRMDGGREVIEKAQERAFSKLEKG